MAAADLAGPVEPHHPSCFGCGPANPGGLGLRLFREGERIRARVRFDERHSGAPGFAHGGAISGAMDETIASLITLHGRPAVTARLEVTYHRPVRLHRELDVEAWTEGTDGRKLHLAGEMRDAGETVVSARALFVGVPFEHFAEAHGAGADASSAALRRWGEQVWRRPPT